MHEMSGVRLRSEHSVHRFAVHEMPLRLERPTRLASYCLSAGYFENFRLQVPAGPYTWDPKLGGIIFPKWRQKVSTKWSGSSAGEVSVLTGRVWDTNASELLVQPLMYGKFMEYGHNGEVLDVRHVSLHLGTFMMVLVDMMLLCLHSPHCCPQQLLGSV